MTKQSFISGEKIDLCRIDRDDLASYADWLDDSEVTELLEMGARPTREKDEDAFWTLVNDTDDAITFGIREKSSGKIVGTCGLYLIQWICRRAQFNILIGDKSVWENGYGTEACRLTVQYGFEKLNLNSIQLGVNSENKRALRSYEKCGFVKEGERRQFIFRNGRYYDLTEMSILREEFTTGKSDG
ncbi:MAG TPA: N-acetyltransferase [Rhodospirillaceae bacterium]|nr:RimJ/RimL family protein N-acetyltransferase [Rhodospirillaceae bacterium]HAT35734.1 N-acetyltransferase [Rhodospirillaceae bacterium]|tara:strand:+ start:60 stop:617 length:558 start_codon:yes stop_codon:yes gene_type:complete